MKALIFGNGITIFFLFFGVALLEAFESGNWLKAAFWVVIGAVFLIADSPWRSEQP